MATFDMPNLNLSWPGASAWATPHSPAYWQQNQQRGWAQGQMGALSPGQLSAPSIAGLYGPTPPGYMGAPAPLPAWGNPVPSAALPTGTPAPGVTNAQPGMPFATPAPAPLPNTPGSMPPIPQGTMTADQLSYGSGVSLPQPSQGLLAANMTPANYGGPPTSGQAQAYGVQMPQSISGQTPAELNARLGPINDQITTQGNIDFAKNLGLAQTVIGGAQTLGNLGMGIYSLYKSADAYDFQKSLVQKNLENSTKSYNTAMDDRIRGRHSFEYNAANKSQLDTEISRKSLSDKLA